MPGESFTRPHDKFRFEFAGMKTNRPPDALQPDKYPYAQNVRATDDFSVETRPGQVLSFITGGNPITDYRAYVALNTDGLPRFLVRDSLDKIWLDTGAQVGTLNGGGASPGATFIPFRPNQSPNPYMYIANGFDYQKFSAPTPGVVQQNVGIAEPQPPPEAGPLQQQFTEVLSPGGNWNTGGTASAWAAGNRSSDIVVVAIRDPGIPQGHPGDPQRYSVQVSPNVQYQRGEVLYLNAFITSPVPPFTTSPVVFITIVEDVIPPLSISMQVTGIYYFTGTTGRCVITLMGITSPGKTKAVASQSGVAIPNAETIAQLRRGALVTIGTETCYVLSVTTGPDNQICIETVTGVTHTVGEIVIGQPTIVINGVYNASLVNAGTPIIGDQGNVETFSVATGVGTLTSGPPGGGPTGTIIARPIVGLNGWGPNAHVGAYELGVNQAYNWGLDPSTTSPYANAALAFDGNTTTFASAVGQHTHTYYGCIWTFNPIAPQSGMVLNINSRVLANGNDGFTISNRSAGIWYSLDAGTTWIQIYNQGSLTTSAGPRPQQWDSVPLSSSQDISKVQVMAFTDSHDDMVHYVYEINISQGAASIGISTGAYQDDDYLHFSVNVSDPTQLVEMKLQFDVSDGTFQDNYYYYSVRPSDLSFTVTNAITQLGAAQAIVMETQAAANAADTAANVSGPTVGGVGQWTEIWVPISGLTRIGGDQTKTLAKIVSVQALVNTLNTISVSISSICFVGGGQPDVGDIGEPYRYRVRPRSAVTGAIGNPSPETRYGVIAHRQPISVSLPAALYNYDNQIDTLDIYRFGGAVETWRFIGSIPVASLPSTNNAFRDNYSDDAAEAGDALDFDNFEPWPSIDVPFAASATVVGTEAVVTIPSPTNALRFLPGNLVRVGGQNVYTLRKRPVLLSGTSYLFEFVECAGASAATIAIYEPAIARQFLPYMWGPDVSGTVFACGDPLRPGTLYFAKNNAPDSAPDSYNIELCPPSEPLLGGIIVDGLSYVSSTERWWALYPNPGNPAQRFNPVQVPTPRGLAAPFGCTTDGVNIFYWAKDGIRNLKDSLTDEDLYDLFPHDGVLGVPSTYGQPTIGHTVLPPDYSQAGKFRLTYSNYYIYATYVDNLGAYNTLVFDTHRDAWSVDLYPQGVTQFYHPEQQAGTLLSTGFPTRYPELTMADITGTVYVQTKGANDNTTPISCAIAVFEFDGGDIRAPKQWGDIFFDAQLPAPAGLTVSPMSLGTTVGTPVVLATNPQRVRQPIGVGGIVISDFMGMFFTWVDDYTTQTVPTTLFSWQSSYEIQPAYTASWTTFGTSFGVDAYMHLRQLNIAYVSTAPVTITITSYDGQSPAPITLPSTGGQYVKTTFPFTANKGMLYRFAGSSTAKFQFFLDDSELYVGPWGRQDAYLKEKTLSGIVVSSGPA